MLDGELRQTAPALAEVAAAGMAVCYMDTCETKYIIITLCVQNLCPEKHILICGEKINKKQIV